MGLDRNGDSRPLAAAGQPRTDLDISTPEGLGALDYDQDVDNGLQYGFAAEMSLADCESLGASPVVSLAIEGEKGTFYFLTKSRMSRLASEWHQDKPKNVVEPEDEGNEARAVQ
jgi:hypothetical protein